MSNYTTQMDAARKGIVTPEIEKVAKKEKMDVDKLMELEMCIRDRQSSLRQRKISWDSRKLQEIWHRLQRQCI